MAPGLPLSPRVQHNGPRWLVPHLGWRDDGRGCEIHIQNLVLYRPGRLQATKTPEVAWIPRLEVGKAPVTRSLRRQTWPWPISGNSPGGRVTCPMEYHMALAQLPVSLDWLKHQGQWGAMPTLLWEHGGPGCLHPIGGIRGHYCSFPKVGRKPCSAHSHHPAQTLQPRIGFALSTTGPGLNDLPKFLRGVVGKIWARLVLGGT